MAEAVTKGAWAGIATGAGAWATSTQLQYAGTYYACAHGFSSHIVVALVLAAISAMGGFYSMHALRRLKSSGAERLRVEPRQLLGYLGVLSSALFTLVILLQGSASLLVPVCQR